MAIQDHLCRHHAPSESQRSTHSRSLSRHHLLAWNKVWRVRHLDLDLLVHRTLALNLDWVQRRSGKGREATGTAAHIEAVAEIAGDAPAPCGEVRDGGAEAGFDEP